MGNHHGNMKDYSEEDDDDISFKKRPTFHTKRQRGWGENTSFPLPSSSKKKKKKPD
jgi:hypothetical protein